jgi:hypothetical protein
MCDPAGNRRARTAANWGMGRNGKLIPRMAKASETRWLRLRVTFALGLLVLLAFELAGHQSLLVTLPQALLILGIIATSALDLRDLRRRRAAAGQSSK